MNNFLLRQKTQGLFLPKLPLFKRINRVCRFAFKGSHVPSEITTAKTIVIFKIYVLLALKWYIISCDFVKSSARRTTFS